MRAKFVILCFLSIAVTACKGEKSIDDLEIVNPRIVEDPFKITLTIIGDKDDDVALFYTTDGSTNFVIAPIWKGIKGSQTEQKMVYELPAGQFPTQLRMDFAFANGQERVILKAVKLEYKGQDREISGNELAVFFRADPTKCTFDGSTGIITALVKNGKQEIPSIYPQEALLLPEIKKLAD